MAKGRWYRRVRFWGRGPDQAGGRPAPAPPPQPAPEELVTRLEALGEEVRRARAAAAERAVQLEPDQPVRGPVAGLSPSGRRHRRVAAVAGAAVLIIGGVLVGLAATSSGHHARLATTSPPTTTPAITTPATPSPETTVSAPTTTTPPQPSTPSPPPGPTVPPSTVVVRPGDSLWSIAAGVVRGRLGAEGTVAQIAGFWIRLIQANSARLPYPRRPDLIYAGMTLVLPAVG